jgi:ribosome-associated translation inhibitor RaiA
METITLSFRGMRTSATFEAAVRAALSNVESRAGTIDRGHVSVGPADPFRLAVDLAYRHHRVFVVREGRDLYAVLQEVIDAVERQVLEVKHRQESVRLAAQEHAS